MSKLLASRFANAPVLVSSDRADWLSDCISAASMEMEKVDARISAEPVVMQDDFWPASDSWLCRFRPYNVVGGTLIIPVKGVMLHEFSYTFYDWATGYIYIQKAFERGMADPFVKRIALAVNSGGGDVAGNFDLVDRMFSYKGQKPVHAFVNEHSYSAAFSITSVADKIYMPRTGGVGSVGVLTSHVDMSKMLDERGVKITLIHSGQHKVDGNPFAALPDDVKARIQARIDGMRELFASTVARNLGLTVEQVMATEALTYGATEAIEIGFAHEIRPIDEALAAFSGELDDTTVEEETMELTAEQEKAVQERISTASAAAKVEGVKEGAAAERTRISGILTHAEAEGRGPLASHLALQTEQSVEAAAGILAATPKAPAASAEKPKNTGADFAAAMENGNPNIPAGGGDQQQTSAEDEEKLFLSVTGYGSKA